MKKAFIGLLILVLSAWAQYVFSAEPIQLARMNPYVAGVVSAASYSNPCPGSWGFCESFDSSSSCYSGDTGLNCTDTWVKGGTGTQNFKDSSSPLEGSYSYTLDTTTAYGYATNVTDACTTECYGYALIQLASYPAGTRMILGFVGADSPLTAVQITAAGKIISVGGGAATASTQAIGNGKVHLWWYYKKGTGANAITWAGFSSDGTMPTCTVSGNYCSYIGTSTLQTDVRKAGIGALDTSTGLNVKIDKYIMSSSSIGNMQ
jgi:hypothetical protein